MSHNAAVCPVDCLADDNNVESDDELHKQKFMHD